MPDVKPAAAVPAKVEAAPEPEVESSAEPLRVVDALCEGSGGNEGEPGRGGVLPCPPVVIAVELDKEPFLATPVPDVPPLTPESCALCACSANTLGGG